VLPIRPDALIMASHTGDAIGDRQVLARQVANNVRRTLVERDALVVVEVVGLEAVRQAEDRLAAVVVEAGLARSEGELEQIRVILVAPETMGAPGRPALH